MTSNEVNTDNWFSELMVIIMIGLLTFCAWCSWKVDQDLRLEINQLKAVLEKNK